MDSLVSVPAIITTTAPFATPVRATLAAAVEPLPVLLLSIGAVVLAPLYSCKDTPGSPEVPAEVSVKLPVPVTVAQYIPAAMFELIVWTTVQELIVAVLPPSVVGAEMVPLLPVAQ